MKIVLFTYEFEPITVIEVDLSLIRRLVDNHCNRFRIAMPSKLKVACWENPIQPIMIECRSVDIDIHKMHFFGKEKFLFLVNDNDLVKSFELLSTTLPGQRDSLEREFQRGFAKGIMAAVTFLGNSDD